MTEQPSTDKQISYDDLLRRLDARTDPHIAQISATDVAAAIAVRTLLAERDAAVARAEAAEAERDEYEQLATERFNALADQDVQIEALAAVIEKVRALAEESKRTQWLTVRLDRLTQILDADPSTVLAERDAQKWDEGAADLASQIYPLKSFPINPHRARAEPEES